jgi:hypothetical protein
LRLALVLILLVQAAGCAGRDRHPAPIQQPASMERPARPIGEEQSFTDKMGEVGVAILVVGVAIVLIALPIIFLAN